MKIFLDPGHGGNNPGARGPNGIREADVNLDIALRTGRLLQSEGYSVRFSRVGDESVSLQRRAALANEWGADYFVSIHCNSNINPIYKGTETFYYREGSVSETFALQVNTSLVAEIDTRDRGASQANFAVLRLTDMPAILVEVAFISNPQEAALLAMPAFKQRCAVGISRGIITFTQ